MSGISSMIDEIRVEALIPFSLRPSPTYMGERLEQLMSSIERVGLMYPIIVRPTEDGKYEIICGHNRVEAAKALGYDVIRADIRNGLSDDEALGLFYDSNLNQQSFSDWNYSQKIEAVRYSEKLIRENSQQGRRTDIEKKRLEDAGDGTCVQGRQKSDENSKPSKTRDKMARRLGISTATLSKYRRIIRPPDDLVDSIAQLLDEKKDIT